jgi:hypothetical protein
VLGLSLVRPLEDDWRASIDGVARARGWPTTREPAKLGKLVAELSAAYNDPRRASATMRAAGAARLGFFFARDVPKAAGAVRELVACGMVPPREGRLRVLDIGAGLGASTWGLVRALEASGARGEVDATWVDADEEALAVGSALARARATATTGTIELRVRAISGRLEQVEQTGQAYDVILAGQLLSELDVGADEGDRIARQADLLASWMGRRLASSGSLVVIEPALRHRTRALHQVRDALAGRAGVTVFAPCLHEAPCPALERPSDWCHEDLPVDLPDWLVPVSRAAGLRHEGLTFSYLVLRKDGARLSHRIGGAGATHDKGIAKLRVVSGMLRSKGKREAYVCGELDGPQEVGGAKAVRLDRDADEANARFESTGRGDVVLVDPATRKDGGGGRVLVIDGATRVTAAETR